MLRFKAFLFYFCLRVDKLSTSIENQTEMLEKVYKLLAAKENVEVPPRSHPSLDVKLWEWLANQNATPPAKRISVRKNNSNIKIFEMIAERHA